MNTPIPYSEYKGLQGVRWSELEYMHQSPLAYQQNLWDPKAATRGMDNGSAIHTAVLEPELFDESYTWWDGIQNGYEWEGVKAGAEAAGMTVLKPEQWQACTDAAKAVHLLRQGREARRVMRGCQREVTLRWIDPRTHIRCKARPDLVGAHVLADVKTTTTVEARKFGRLAGDRLYHGKMAMALMGLRELGKRIDVVRVIAIEQAAPHDVAVYYLTQDQLDAGIDLVNELLAKLKLCRRKRSWPGRQEHEQPLELAPWLLPSENDIEGMGIKFA
jgi:hypothetical protein